MGVYPKDLAAGKQRLSNGCTRMALPCSKHGGVREFHWRVKNTSDNDDEAVEHGETRSGSNGLHL